MHFIIIKELNILLNWHTFENIASHIWIARSSQIQQKREENLEHALSTNRLYAIFEETVMGF